jgi:hypothetical protein
MRGRMTTSRDKLHRLAVKEGGRLLKSTTCGHVSAHANATKENRTLGLDDVTENDEEFEGEEAYVNEVVPRRITGQPVSHNATCHVCTTSPCF